MFTPYQLFVFCIIPYPRKKHNIEQKRRITDALLFCFFICEPLNIFLLMFFRIFKKLINRNLKNFCDNIYFLIGGKPQLTLEF